MKKLKLSAVIAISAMLVFTGCGNNAETTDENTADSSVMEAANEIESVAKELTAAVDEAFKSGTMDQARYDEFKGYLSRLDEIKNSGKTTDEIKSELADIKSELAVIASQASASNEIIDSLVSSSDALETDKKAEPKDSSIAASGINDVIREFSENYIQLQNEASRKVELGEISQEEYTDLIEMGIEIAELKDKAESGIEEKDMEQRLADIKAKIYDYAVKTNSELAEKFK